MHLRVSGAIARTEFGIEERVNRKLAFLAKA
jgi:hypothetical protein